MSLSIRIQPNKILNKKDSQGTRNIIFFFSKFVCEDVNKTASYVLFGEIAECIGNIRGSTQTFISVMSGY